MQERATQKWLKVGLLLLVMLPVVLGGCSGGGKELPSFNITGAWYFYIVDDNVKGMLPLGPVATAFTQSTNDLTGATPPVPENNNIGYAITGTVEGVAVAFEWTEIDGTLDIFSGTVFVDGTMSGNWTRSNSVTGSKQTGTWNAIVFVGPLVDLNNTTWNSSSALYGGAGGQQPGTFTFQVSPNASENNTLNDLSGTVNTVYQGSTYQAPLKGSITSLTVLFFWTGPDGALYTYKATVSGGNTMNGTWANDRGQSGNWIATKNG